MTDDAELLRQYAQCASESSFAELVNRHLPLVFSAALRQLSGDEQMAEDVAQAVFTELARKAASLSRREVLAAWLYTTTRFAAVKIIRGDCRRRNREQAAVAMQECPINPASEPDWDQLNRVLDEAMSELSRADKTAVLLRFFEAKELKTVGAALGISEDAARKRVKRALEKLRDLFAHRGIDCTAAALGTSLSAHAVLVVPSGLAAVLSASALTAAASATAGTTLTTSLYHLMLTTKLKIGLLILAAAITTTTLVIQHKAIHRLRTQTRQSLQQSTQGPRVQDQAPSAVPAIDLVKAGEDVAWSDGYVLHVARRDGASLGGIRITCKGKDGQVTTTTADKGTVSNSGAAESHGVLYTNFVRITLENAHAQGADGTVKEYKQARFFLHQ